MKEYFIKVTLEEKVPIVTNYRKWSWKKFKLVDCQDTKYSVPLKKQEAVFVKEYPPYVPFDPCTACGSKEYTLTYKFHFLSVDAVNKYRFSGENRKDQNTVFVGPYLTRKCLGCGKGTHRSVPEDD